VERAIVVLSGGQDSCTALVWARTQFEVAGAIHFKYGQKHKQETVYARAWADHYNVPMSVVQVPSLAQVGQSALTSGGDTNKAHPTLRHLPASFVPGRNLVFTTLAAAYAMKLGAQHVVLGVGQADFSGYPDCRSETMKALQATLRLGLDFPELEIQTPLMWKSKAETFKLAYDLGVLPDIVSNTLTGYDGKEDMLHEWGWGPLDDADFDPASALRAKGWQEFAEQFPYEYAAYCAGQGLKGKHL